MGPSRAGQVVKCQICKDQISKYKCPACPIRYCSVACYKQHKVTHEDPSSDPSSSSSQLTPAVVQDESAPLLDVTLKDDTLNELDESEQIIPKKRVETPLKPLTSLLWPPEPDPSIFTDPLQKEDPKPLKHEELLRIATSIKLRNLLSNSKLPLVLRTIDSLSFNKRHEIISKLLNLDNESLNKSNGITSSFLSSSSSRNSPPPLNDLIYSFTSNSENQTSQINNNNNEEEGWYLYSKDQKEKIWITENETKLFKLFSTIICFSIDENENENQDEIPSWGKGGLEWEL
ncbi:uncharacterized protein I206_104563 [Kwoniella pini CBS 10737]|uniref:HIT-type domain-containing protein n=1 Tax=Kwoniella pini CBS 10737 TaxID=1296096 RepID=A0AAJ8MRD8_9TREE